jgi:hypothetical protein
LPLFYIANKLAFYLPTQIKEKYYITQLLFINHHDHDIKKNLKSRWNESPPPNAAWKK